MNVTSKNYIYTDPTFMGVGWFIRCDEDGARLIIRSRAKTLKAALYKARRALRGLPVTVRREEGYTTRAAFPPKFLGLAAAWSFALEISGTMPDTSCYEARRARRGISLEASD